MGTFTRIAYWIFLHGAAIFGLFILSFFVIGLVFSLLGIRLPEPPVHQWIDPFDGLRIAT